MAFNYTRYQIIPTKSCNYLNHISLKVFFWLCHGKWRNTMGPRYYSKWCNLLGQNKWVNTMGTMGQ